MNDGFFFSSDFHIKITFRRSLITLKGDSDGTVVVAVVVVIVVVLRLLLAVLQLHSIISFAKRTSEPLVVGLQSHRDALGQATRIPAAVHVYKDAAKN